MSSIGFPSSAIRRRIRWAKHLFLYRFRKSLKASFLGTLRSTVLFYSVVLFVCRGNEYKLSPDSDYLEVDFCLAPIRYLFPYVAVLFTGRFLLCSSFGRELFVFSAMGLEASMDNLITVFFSAEFCFMNLHVEWLIFAFFATLLDVHMLQQNLMPYQFGKHPRKIMYFALVY